MCSFVSASMADPLCGSDFFLDTTNIKQEPVAMDAESVGVPIPRRTVTQRPQIMDMSELQDFTFSFDENMLGGAQQMSSVFSGWQLVSDTSYPVGPSLVITRPEAEGDVTRISDSFKMEEDDIFQVDKADLIQGPTLAELNANDDTLLDDLSFDDLLLPDESSCYILPDKMSGAVSVQTAVNQPVMNVNATASKDVTNQNFIPSSFPPNGQGFYRESFASSSVPSNSAVESFPKTTAMTYTAPSQSTSPMLLQKSTVRSPNVSPLQQKHSTLHELLLKKETLSSPDSQLGQSVPKSTPMAVSPILTSRLSSSAPTHLGFEQLWQRREPRPHLLSTGSLAEAGSTSSLSTGGVLSPESHEFSHDEGFDSEDDSDHYEDMSSDGESSDGECGESKLASALSKRERYFWQYNVQAKGPKGQRLVLKTKLEDPHVLNEVMDPVFSPQCAVRGIKHSGKARKGDGNDLTPNPRKLHSIGKELDKLGRLINEMTPVSELPFNVRPKTRKEKNKLASRACRLKKKAQHEANKLKLYGLEHEHRRLIHAIEQMKQLVAAKCTQENAQNPEEVLKFVEKLMKGATKVRIAGHTTDFVNKVLEKVKSGVPDGGITDM